MPEEKAFEAETNGELTIIRFSPGSILTGHVAQNVGDQLVNLVEVQGCRRLVLNFANVASLTSLIIGKLATLHKKLQAAGGRVVICEATPVIFSILDVVKLTSLITVYTTEQAALESLR